MTLEEIKIQIIDYQEKLEKMGLLLIDLHNKLNSVERQASVQDGFYTGEIFSFEIIDRTVVETYPLTKGELSFFRSLDAIRTMLMNMNFRKQLLLGILSLSYTDNDKAREANNFRALAQANYATLQTEVENIERILASKFDVTNPFKSR